VSVTGGGGTGNVVASVGVHVANGGGITASGTGTVDVAGYGAAGAGNANYGVLVQGANSVIGSSGGAVTVTGESDSNVPGYGTFLFYGGKINTTGALALTTNSYVPGSIGTDITASTTTFTDTGTDLVLAVGGTAVDTGYTQLNVNGAVDLTNLDLTLVGGFVPVQGTSTFTLVSAANITGTFNGLAQFSTIVFNGVTLTIIYTPTSVIAVAL